MDVEARGRRVLQSAYEAWMRMAGMRERRRRYVRYTYGDQWSDPAVDREGRVVTEGDLASTGGRKPLTNNLIRRMVKSVVGRWRQMREQEKSPSDGGGEESGWREANEVDELDARTLEEFLISGIAVHHVGLDRNRQVRLEAVSPEAFFVSGVNDARCSEMEMVGRLLSLSLQEVVRRFARGDREKAMELRRLYGSLTDAGRVFGSDTIAGMGQRGGCDLQFFRADGGRCRVVEVWTLESVEVWQCHDRAAATLTVTSDPDAPARIAAENALRRKAGKPETEVRWDLRNVWHCRMMAPNGTVLSEYDSPLKGGGHPFAVKLYPLVDGDVHSLVEDVIEQQRYVNTLITMLDRMMGTAAKGALLFPVSCKPDGVKWSEVSRAWSDPGGIIPYKPCQNGIEPRQVVTPVADIGARDMLRTQISLFEDVSGVSNVLMGKAAGTVVGAERYESEVREATVAVLDLMRTFGHFVKVRDRIAETLHFS